MNELTESVRDPFYFLLAKPAPVSTTWGKLVVLGVQGPCPQLRMIDLTLGSVVGCAQPRTSYALGKD